jgi:protein-disulfide isomerase
MSKSHNNSVKENQDEILNLLLVPISIVLTGVLITASILYSANVILERDQLVTKTTLRKVLQEELSKNQANTTQEPTVQAPPQPVTVSEDMLNNLKSTHLLFLGDRNSKVHITEFADPSCPFCSLASGDPSKLSSYPGYTPPLPEIEKLVKEGKASYAWVYLPTHGNGEVAAQVFYCAYEKGVFWEVHNKLMVGEGYNKVEYEVRNDVNKVNILSDYVKDIVDPEFINQCVKSGKYKEQLSRDMALANQWSVSATPTIFVNTEQAQSTNFVELQASISKYQN